MVPAEDQWQLAGAQDLFHFLCELRAGSHDLAEVLQLVSRLRSRLRSLEMQVAEVATAAQERIGAIWVVLADHDLSMVSQGMAALESDPSFDQYYELGWNDLAVVAQGLGAEASNAQSVGEVAAALDRAIKGAETGVPQVVVVAIDATEAPPYDYQPLPPPAATH